MNATIRFAVCLAIISGTASAAEPMTGRVLLLDEDRLLEGEIERDGNRFRIRGTGGEMSIPAAPTMVLLPNRESAYSHLRARARLADPRDRVRLARWCLANQLPTQAVTEAEAALTLLPNDRSLKQFVDETRLRASLAPPPSVTETPTTLKPETPEAATADVNPESFSLFVTKVQPLLLNACGQCHAGDRGGKLNLTQTATTFGDKRATQLNLVAASQFLDREQPSNSPLLLRAITVHGDSARPPLRDRQSAAFKHLEEWARLATGRPLTPAPLPSAAIVVSQPLMPEAPRVPLDPAVTPAIALEPSRRAAPATPLNEPDDPFDPEPFNRQNTPPKK